MDGDGLEIIYRNATSRPATPSPSAAAPSGWSFTQTDPGTNERTYISIGVRSNNMGNYTWSVTSPITAVDGTDGVNGDPAPRYAEIVLYTNPAVVQAPNAPSATITWSDGDISSITSGWSRTPPTEVVSSQQRVYSSRLVFVDSTGVRTTSSDTGDQPVQATNFSGLVTFTGGDFAVDGATITNIDGGNITTRSITASQLETGTITANEIATGAITADELAANFILSRTVRSINYVGPNLSENPPIQGYSLEHGQGIGFFEELRANVIGTIRAPSIVSSTGISTWGPGNVVSRQYLNITTGTQFQNFDTTAWESGRQWRFRGVLSNPIWRLDNITAPRPGVVGGADNLPGTIQFLEFDDSGVEMYSQLTEASAYTVTVMMLGIPYSNGQIIPNFLPLSDITSFGTIDDLVTGFAQTTQSGNTDSNRVNDTGTALFDVPFGAVVPDRVDFALWAGFTRDVTHEGTAGLDSDFSMVAGINANSSVTIQLRNEDGSSTTQTLTQLPA